MDRDRRFDWMHWLAGLYWMDWLFWIDLSGELVALDGLAGWDNHRTDG